MKFMAKQQQTMNIMSTSNHDSTDGTQSTETEESDEEGTGNTGKPKRCWHHETYPSNSDELAVYIEAAHRIETLFEAKLLKTDTSKGRGGCDGL